MVRAVTIRPDFTNAHFNLGMALGKSGQLDDSARHYEIAAELAPDFTDAHFNLGSVRMKQGRGGDAEACFRRVIDLNPDDGEAHFNLGNVLRDIGRNDEAVAAFQHALTCSLNDIRIIKNLGNLLTSLNRPDEALAVYRQGLGIDPGMAEFHGNIALIKKFKDADEDVQAMEDLLARAEPVKDVITLNFALGKAYRDMGALDRAFRYFADGCRVKRATLGFDIAAHEARMARIAETFNAEFMRRPGDGARPEAAPIFIVGMPRSGSTLVEQILSSHSHIFGAGELKLLPDLVADWSEDGHAFPAVAAGLPRDAFARLGAAYAEGVARLAPGGRPHVTDKMLENFLYIGVIHMALPNARIIHCRRDPLDTCLSCLTTDFLEGNKFTYDQGELGRYYRAYDRLMAHWNEVLPGRIFETRYEDMIDDHEGETRRILAFCGLEWEDACRDFHATERKVWTASMVQVRNPIYRTSVKGWKGIEAHFGPLLDALGPLAADN